MGASHGYARQSDPPPRPSVVVVQGAWEASVRVTGGAAPPTSFVWSTADGRRLEPVRLPGGEVRLPPGEYRVVSRDRRGRSSEAQEVRVTAPSMPVVRAYMTTPASTDSSRDGRVFAVLENLPRGPGAVTMLWSSGHRTAGPVLDGARAGTYAGLVVEAAGVPVWCMHACEPASVGVGGGTLGAPAVSADADPPSDMT
jgi:hypothetical protein